MQVAAEITAAKTVPASPFLRAAERLSFDGELEREFRAANVVASLRQIRIALFIGLLFTLAVSGLDIVMGPKSFSNISVPVRTGIMAPVILAALIATFYEFGRRHLAVFSVAVGLSIGLVSLLLNSLAAGQGVNAVFAGYLVVTFYVYLFLGLTFWPAVLTACCLYVAFILIGHFDGVTQQASLIYNGLFLTFCNLIGGAGLYNLERSRRAEFHYKRNLEAANKELHQANQEVRDFAYIVSHDLRGPLVNINGFAGELQDAVTQMRSKISETANLPKDFVDEVGQLLSDDVNPSLDFIGSSVTQMNSRIDSILRLARLGQVEFQHERLDLKAIVDSIVETHRHELSDCDALVNVAPLPEIEIDRTAMEQIADNLIGNAIKYRAPDRPLELGVWADNHSDGITLHVKDNGRGIAKEDLSRIFEMFRRVGTQDTAGDGMGLAYTRALIRRLKGNISVDSALGDGTSFHVQLPNASGLAPGY